MALFIALEVDPAAAKDAAVVKKLVEVCPVNIFAQKGEKLEIVDAHLDECTLCELCLEAASPGAVRVKKLYSGEELVQK